MKNNIEDDTLPEKKQKKKQKKKPNTWLPSCDAFYLSTLGCYNEFWKYIHLDSVA